MEKSSKHFWTKEEIRITLELWSTMTVAQIANKLHLRNNQVAYMINVIRKTGYNLPKKSVAGKTAHLVKEVLHDLNLS